MKIHRCSAWLFAGLICLAALLMFTTNLPRRDAFHGKNVRDWAVKLSYAPEQKQRTAAATSLRNFGPDAVPALVEMLRAKSPFYQPLLAKLAFLLPA